MNTNLTVEYKKWIEKLSKPNFDELILNYAKEYYETKDVWISDGPYDGSKDLTYRIGGIEQKRNIQITVQEKQYEKKLEEDLEKSKNNVVSFNYFNSLDFYISQPITPEKKKKLIKNADVKYQITLRIIDANELAGLAQEYKSIRSTIYKFNKTAFPEEKLEINDKTKILFDTLSMGSDVASIKNNFVQSLILTKLYEAPDLTVEEIFNSLTDVFYNKYTKTFFEAEVGRLKNNAKVVDMPNTQPKKFRLTDKTQEALEQIYNNAEIHEAELINQFKNVLQRYGLEKETKYIVTHIIDLYNANYASDENEILEGNNNHNAKIQQIFSNLQKHLIRQHKLDDKTVNDITKQLLDICSNNEYLNKISISKMFTNLFKSDKLETYLSKSKRVVFLDTQILLQIICCYYENIEYEDQLYKNVQCFLDTIEDSEIPIELHTTIGYVEEVAWQLYNGLSLERFLDLDFVKDLGQSKNVFFNFYSELKKNSINFVDFKDFIEDLLDVQISSKNEKIIIAELMRNLRERFEMSDIIVDTPPIYDEKQYAIYRKQYEIELSYLKYDQKSYDARKNDLNTILYLSDRYYDSESGYFTEPYLITWDASFYNVRSAFRKFTELNFWYLYSPTKFANTVSVMNMKIDATAINYNIISLVEDNFNLSNDTISFIDLINSFIGDKDLKKWKLANKLAKLRKRLQEDTKEEDLKINHKNLPIDELLLFVQKHYQNSANKKNYQDLTDLFQNNDYADRISKIIEDNLVDFQKNKNQILKYIDEMIAENKA